MEGIGAGLAALAFWGFIASVVVSGVWYSVRERDAQHETMRRLIESGQTIDQALVDKILHGDNRPDRQLKIGGLITIFVAPGLAILAWFLSKLAAPLLFPLLGAAGLVAFVGIGLLVAARFAERAYRENDTSNSL